MTSTLSPALGVASLSPIRVLLAEDETHLGSILEQYLTARGFDVTMVRDGRAALDALRAHTFDVALLDIVMPEVDGLEVLRLVREEPLPPEVIVITGNGTIETAMAALKLGAYDFLSKPYRMAEIDALVRRAWEKHMLVRDNHALQARVQRNVGDGRFVTQYAPLLAVRSLIERVAPSASPVLLSGEAGTGKRLVARMLHAHGARPSAPFLELRCAELSAAAQEAELFGVERAASAEGASGSLGLLELASGGTLYLDQVGTLALGVQDRLLRALETGGFERVGGAQRVRLQVRPVASTTRDLARATSSGQFREELLHRLSAIRVSLPPLRERFTDIALLAQHFLDGFDSRVALTRDAVDALERYRWPGNVRELRNVIERAVLLAVDGRIAARDLPLNDVMVGVPSFDSAGGAVDRAVPTAPLTLEAVERQHIAHVLELAQWHQGRAAEMLDISPKTLYRKIREFGFKRPSGPR
jgi:DNA-binding NtrC family response regulator